MIRVRKFFKVHFYNMMSIVTIGFPFAAYKFLAGDICMNMSGGDPIGIILFHFFAIWAIIDFIFNFHAMMTILITGSNPGPVCLLAMLAKKFRATADMKGIGEAFDLFLSFSIVAWLVGFGLLPKLSEGYVYVWNISTAVNVLGAGTARLALYFIGEKSGKDIKRDKDEDEPEKEDVGKKTQTTA